MPCLKRLISLLIRYIIRVFQPKRYIHNYLGTDHLTYRGGGGVMVFVSFRIFFSNYTRVRILFFLSRKARIVFFPEYNITLFDKNSKSDLFSSNKIRIFFSVTLGIRIFKKKNPYPPPPFQVKWSFPYLTSYIMIYGK